MSKSVAAFAVLAASTAGAFAQSPVTPPGWTGTDRGWCLSCYSGIAAGPSAMFSGPTSNSAIYMLEDGNLAGYSAKRGDNGVQVYARDAPASAPYGIGGLVGDPTANRAWGVSLGLERGAWTLRVAHQNRNAVQITPSTPLGNNMDAKNSIAAVNVKLGPAIAYAAYSANRGWGGSPLWNPDNPYSASFSSTPSTDSRDVLVGVAVPRGATTYLASFIRKNDRDLANRDADQLAFGATYAMSRRTDFYAAYSHTRNRNGLRAAPGTALDAGANWSAINVGMRHAF